VTRGNESVTFPRRGTGGKQGDTREIHEEADDRFGEMETGREDSPADNSSGRGGGGRRKEERRRERGRKSRKDGVMAFREIRPPPPLIMDKTIINSNGAREAGGRGRGGEKGEQRAPRSCSLGNIN